MEIHELVLNCNIFEFILEYFTYKIIYVINQSYFLIVQEAIYGHGGS